MESKSSITPSQLSATYPLCEPNESSPNSQIHFLNINFNIIPHLRPSILYVFFSFKFPHQYPISKSPLPHPCYKPHPLHPSWFNHSNNVWWEANTTQLLSIQSLPVPCHWTVPKKRVAVSHRYMVTLVTYLFDFVTYLQNHLDLSGFIFHFAKFRPSVMKAYIPPKSLALKFLR